MKKPLTSTWQSEEQSTFQGKFLYPSQAVHNFQSNDIKHHCSYAQRWSHDNHRNKNVFSLSSHPCRGFQLKNTFCQNLKLTEFHIQALVIMFIVTLIFKNIDIYPYVKPCHFSDNLISSIFSMTVSNSITRSVQSLAQ